MYVPNFTYLSAWVHLATYVRLSASALPVCCCRHISHVPLPLTYENYIVESEIPTSVVVKGSIFWYVTPCSPLKRTTWRHIPDGGTL
jgi:hypothetical protein